MQEKDYAKLKTKYNVSECNYSNVEPLYELGANDGYVCTDCGLRLNNRGDFERHRKTKNNK